MIISYECEGNDLGANMTSINTISILLYRLHFLACSVEATAVVDDEGATAVSTVDAAGVGAIAGVLGIGTIVEVVAFVFLTASKILSSTMSSKSLVTML